MQGMPSEMKLLLERAESQKGGPCMPTEERLQRQMSPQSCCWQQSLHSKLLFEHRPAMSKCENTVWSS